MTEVKTNEQDNFRLRGQMRKTSRSQGTGMANGIIDSIVEWLALYNIMYGLPCMIQYHLIGEFRSVLTGVPPAVIRAST